MRLMITIVALLPLCFFISCTEDDTVSQVPGYANKLTLGTGTNAANTAITGVETSFRGLGGVAVIYWQLESAADFNGDGVALKIEKQSGSTYTTVDTYPYATPSIYGHRVVSSISVTTSGRFRATGLLTSTSTDVASTTFTVQL